MLISVDFRKSMYGYAMDSRIRDKKSLKIFSDLAVQPALDACSLYIYLQFLHWRTKVKFQGVTVDRRLTLQHIDNMARTATAILVFP